MLMKIESILCPIDMSPDSEHPLRYAIALSRAYHAKLILLHCDLSGPGVATESIQDKAAETLRSSLKEYSGSADLVGLDWRSVVVTCDDAGATISREAAMYGVDLI